MRSTTASNRARILALAWTLSFGACTVETTPSPTTGMDDLAPIDAPTVELDLGRQRLPGVLDEPRAAYNDSDADGLADAEEVSSDPTSADTDGDGIGDLVEVAYERASCTRSEPSCGCALSEECVPPEDFIAIPIVPGTGPTEVEVELEANVRRADVFFLLETTAPMASAYAQVVDALWRRGALARIAADDADIQFAFGGHRDLPFANYGAAGDEVLSVATPPGADWINQFLLVRSIPIGGGGDKPDAHVEALYQLVTGAGARYVSHDGAEYTMRPALGCGPGRGGAGCFRNDALPVVVHVSDSCAHGGPDGDSPACTRYDVALGARSYRELATRMEARAARYVGINASRERCELSAAPHGDAPCHFMGKLASDTGSIDYEGRPLVRDLPSDSVTAAGMLVESALRAIHTVPMDVNAIAASDELSIVRAVAACTEGGSCWEAPAGMAPADAVARVEGNTFLRTVPGTRVSYRVTLENDAVPAASVATMVPVQIELRGDLQVLDTRTIWVVVPAVR